MVSYVDTQENDNIKPAFAKYDKDGSGNIDKEELRALSTDLGHSLNDEELEAALIDLDLNKDGVVDYEEFKRWYLSGMKSYSGKKKTMLKFMHGVGELESVINADDLVDFVKANPQTVE